MAEQTQNQQQGNQQFRCRECGKVLNSSNELREHEKVHKGQGQQGQGQPHTGQAGGGH